MIMQFHRGILNINSGRKLALPGQHPQIAGSSRRMKKKHNLHWKPNTNSETNYYTFQHPCTNNDFALDL